jgi:uncharacterized protein YgiM (DUF1202 family)
MSLRKCKECGNLVSAKAKICPNCGNPIKPKSSCLAVGCLVIIIFIAISTLIGVIGDMTKSNEEKSNNWGQIKYTHGIVNVRSSRNTSSKIIKKLNSNSKVKVDFKSENWYAIFNVNAKKRNISKAIGYVFANEDIYDVPVKTQIELKIIVRENVTAENLRYLLNLLYDQNIKRTGFIYHTNPTNLYIYIYNSEARAKSGGSQWIAMISKSYDDKTPSIRINEKQIKLQYVEKESKYGLSEDARVKIWHEYIKAEDRAELEAEKKYPLTYPAEVTEEKMKKNSEYYDQLNKKYKANIAVKNNLTEEQLEEIVLEGINKQWPYPKYNDRFK